MSAGQGAEAPVIDEAAHVNPARVLDREPLEVAFLEYRPDEKVCHCGRKHWELGADCPLHV